MLLHFPSRNQLFILIFIMAHSESGSSTVVQPQVVTPKHDRYFMLPCSLSRTNNKVTWSKRLQTGDWLTITNTSVLVFNPIRCHDSGLYRCMTINPILTEDTNIRVECKVYCSPFFATQNVAKLYEDNIYHIMPYLANMTCSIDSYPPVIPDLTSVAENKTSLRYVCSPLDGNHTDCTTYFRVLKRVPPIIHFTAPTQYIYEGDTIFLEFNVTSVPKAEIELVSYGGRTWKNDSGHFYVTATMEDDGMFTLNVRQEAYTSGMDKRVWNVSYPVNLTVYWCRINSYIQGLPVGLETYALEKDVDYVHVCEVKSNPPQSQESTVSGVMRFKHGIPLREFICSPTYLMPCNSIVSITTTVTFYWKPETNVTYLTSKTVAGEVGSSTCNSYARPTAEVFWKGEESLHTVSNTSQLTAKIHCFDRTLYYCVARNELPLTGGIVSGIGMSRANYAGVCQANETCSLYIHLGLESHSRHGYALFPLTTQERSLFKFVTLEKDGPNGHVISMSRADKTGFVPFTIACIYKYGGKDVKARFWLGTRPLKKGRDDTSYSTPDMVVLNDQHVLRMVGNGMANRTNYWSITCANELNDGRHLTNSLRVPFFDPGSETMVQEGSVPMDDKNGSYELEPGFKFSDSIFGDECLMAFRTERIFWMYRPIPINYTTTIYEGDDMDLRLRFANDYGYSEIYQTKWSVGDVVIRNFSTVVHYHEKSVARYPNGGYRTYVCTMIIRYDQTIVDPKTLYDTEITAVRVNLIHCDVTLSTVYQGVERLIEHVIFELNEGDVNVTLRCRLRSNDVTIHGVEINHVADVIGTALNGPRPSSMILAKVRSGHKGLISCSSYTYPRRCHGRYILNINYPPKVFIDEPYRNIKLGSKVSLHCKYLSYPIPTKVYWIHKKGNYPTVSDQQNLTIGNFTKFHYGRYACVVTNEFLSIKNQYRLETGSGIVHLSKPAAGLCPPPRISNGHVIVRNTSRYMEVEYFCNMYYRLSGCKSGICQSNTNWTGKASCINAFKGDEVALLAFYVILILALLAMLVTEFHLWRKRFHIRAYEKLRLINLKDIKLEYWKERITQKQMDYLVSADEQHDSRVLRKQQFPSGFKEMVDLSPVGTDDRA